MTRWLPMHGGGGGGAGDEASRYGLNPEFQSFLDSDFGATLALLLHTVGVFAFVAGLGYAGYRLAQRSEATPFRRQDLERARALAWGGLAGNLLGGFMRLAQSDHPGLGQVGTNAWVQLILTKHLVWIGLLVLNHHLFKRVLPRFLGDAPATGAGRPAGRSVLLASVAVLLISVLGAAASTVGVGTMAPMMDDHDEMDDHEHPPEWKDRRTQVTANSVVGTPQNPYQRDHPIDVPPNATLLEIDLSWTSPASTFSVSLLDPNGRPAGGMPRAEAQRWSLELASPPAGQWTLRITSDRALQESYAGEAVAWHRVA